MEIRAFIEDSSSDIESFIRERVELVIGRFSDRIAHVDVHVAQEHSSHGGAEYVCTFDLKMLPRGVVHVSANNDSPQSAIVKAVHRAETAVAKTVDRGHRSRSARHNGEGIRHLSDNLESTEPISDEDE